MLITVAIVTKKQSEKWHEWSNSEKTFRPIVRSDGSGYYAYLPQVFIYQDRRFQFIDSVIPKYPDAKMGEFGTYTPSLKGRMNKFFTGVAVCQAPFFLLAHYTHSDYFPSDGYSLPYQKALALGAIVFLLLGLWLSYLVLLHYRIQPWVAAFSLSVLALGTPMLYYTVNDPLTAHVYSFTLITLFFYSLLRWKASRSLFWLLTVSFSLGMVIILRPSNGIVFLLYFAVFSNVREAITFLVENFIKRITHLLPALVIFTAILFIQFWNVRFQMGEWGFNIYGGEGFDNWAKPPIGQVLFGFKKGLFVYAPLCFISLLGIWFFCKKHRFTALIFVLFFALFTYVTAAWWCWWYGGSLGMRPFIDVTLIFALGLGFLFQTLKPWLKIVFVPVIAFCIYFQFILSIQMDTAILHFADMNQERFWRIFLRTDDRFQWVFHLDEPKKMKVANREFSYWNYNDLSNAFIGTPKWKPGKFEVEHMRIAPIFQIKVDSNFQQYQGVRLYSEVTIRDRHNRPWMMYEIYKDGKWSENYTDLLGMRIPHVNCPASIESDWIFDSNVRNADSIRFRIHNTHGKSTYDKLRFDFH